MNILFLPSWYESEEMPGSGIFFSEQVKALKEAGNSVTVVIVDIVNYPYKCKTKKFCILEQIRDGIEVYRIKIPSYCTGQLPFVFFNYYYFYYSKLMYHLEKKGYQFDVIYAHSFWHAGYIGTLLKKKYNIPLIVQEHRSQLLTGEFRPLVNKYLKKTVLESDVFYCVSERLKEEVYKRTKVESKIKILPNMVNEIFTFKELPVNSDFIFTFIGTLNKRKRIMFLIKAFEKFCTKNTKMLIVGAGPEKNELEEYILKSPVLINNVKLLGFLDRGQIVDVLSKSNVFILPSAYEPFGVVYIEAMAIGRPVIATKNGGANDIINDSNGYLIDVDNEEQLINAMRNMINNYNKFNLKKISQECIENYSKFAVIGKVLQTMNDCKKNEK